MPDRSGVEIYKRFYPWPDAARLGDPVLVSEITGMRWPDFELARAEYSQAVDEAREMGADPPTADPILFIGTVAIAFWQGNPMMTRDKVRRALERISMDDIEVIDGDEGEVDVGPPAQGGVEAAPEMTSNASESLPEQSTETNPPDYISDATNPNGSGLPGLPITSQELSPT